LVPCVAQSLIPSCSHEMTLTSLSITVLPLETTAPRFLPSTHAFKSLLEKHNSPAQAPSSLPRIKAIVLVTPNNPTGSIYPKDLIWEFATICSEWKVALIVDETYREFLLDEGLVSSASDSQLALAKPHDLFDQSAHPGFEWQNGTSSV
jgi:aspartate/methionine/tyrosine aminotransferase